MVYSEENYSLDTLHDVDFTDIKRLYNTFYVEDKCFVIIDISDKKSLAEDLKYLMKRKEIPGYLKTVNNIISVIKLNQRNIIYVKQAVKLDPKDELYEPKLKYLSGESGLSVKSLKYFIGYYGTNRFAINNDALNRWFKEIYAKRKEDEEDLINQNK